MRREVFTREQVTAYLAYVAEQLYLDAGQLEELLREYEHRWMPEVKAND